MSRSLRVPVVLALAVLGLMPVMAASGQSSTPVVADKEGWWNQARDATVGTPLPPPPDTVPEDAIAVGAAGGQPDKVAAIGIVLDAARGSTVERFTMTLKEAEGPGAQQGADRIIVACPITAFFAPEENGALQHAPAADCEVAQVEGVRAAGGIWTFDLVPIANVWLDPFGTINPNGIRLDPSGTGTYQVALTGMEDATFDVAIGAPEEEDDPFDSVTTTVPGGFAGPRSSTGGGSGGSITVTPPPAVDTGPPADAPTATTVADASGDEVAATEEPAASRAGETGGNLPAATFVLLPLAIAIALLAMWHLGPAGRAPHAKTLRAGGVSRALAARSASTGAPT